MLSCPSWVLLYEEITELQRLLAGTFRGSLPEPQPLIPTVLLHRIAETFMVSICHTNTINSCDVNANSQAHSACKAQSAAGKSYSVSVRSAATASAI